MNELSVIQYFLSFGYVVLFAAILTYIIMEIIKSISAVDKKLRLSNGEYNDKQVIFYSRVVACITYFACYVIDCVLIKKQSIIFNEKLLADIIANTLIVMILAKALYTFIKQNRESGEVIAEAKRTIEMAKNINKEVLNNVARGETGEKTAGNSGGAGGAPQATKFLGGT